MQRRGVKVVLYHHLANAQDPLTAGLGATTPPALFAEHLDRFEHEYDVIDLDGLLSNRLPKRPLLITFDDGYRSVLDVAAPMLARRGLPAVVFVSAAFLRPETLPLDNLLSALAAQHGAATVAASLTDGRTSGRDAGELVALSAGLPYAKRVAVGDELAAQYDIDQRELRARSGLFLDAADLPALRAHGCEIGNHTASHLFCRALMNEADAHAELVEHKQQLERWTGAHVRAFSYPYGNKADATPFVERTLAENGHEATFLVEARQNPPTTTRGVNRVSLDERPTRRVGIELELLPRLRSARDAVALR
jgi:peptidoglycan/xylan/chitin deacetylase (PgdA/CDA1 family)